MAGEEAAWRLPHIPFFGFWLPCSPWGQAVNFLKQRDLWEGPCLSLKPLGFDCSRSGHLGTTYARNGHPVLQNLFTLIVQGSVVGWSDKGFVKGSVSMYLTGKPRYTRMIYLLSTRKLGAEPRPELQLQWREDFTSVTLGSVYETEDVWAEGFAGNTEGGLTFALYGQTDRG